MVAIRRVSGLASVEVPDSWAAWLVRALDGTPLANQHIQAWHEAIAGSDDDEDHFGRLVRLLEIEAEAPPPKRACHGSNLTHGPPESRIQNNAQSK